MSSNNGNAGGKDRNSDNESGLHRCIFSDVLWAAKIFSCDIPLSMTEIPFGLIVIAPQRSAPVAESNGAVRAERCPDAISVVMQELAPD